MKNSAKFVLALMLTAASAASCHKEIAVRGEGSGELTLNPQVDALTKAPIAGATFPDARTIVLSAYNNIPGGTSANFFQGITFKKNATLGSWVGGGGTDPKYWPVSGSLDLLAYSADGFSTAPTPSYATKCSESVTFTVPAENKTKQVDILFAGATGKSASGSALPMTFKHAEAVVAFNAKAQVPYDATKNLGVTIDKITLEGVKTYGNVTLKIGGTCSWTGGTPENVDLTGMPSGGYPVTADYINITSTPFGIGNKGIIVIPQTATKFTVNYTVHFGKDSSSKPVNKTETFTYTIPSATWAAGKEYVYQLEFKQDQILVDSEILNWEVIPGGVTVPDKVSATFKDSNPAKTDIDLCAPGTTAKLSAGAIVGFDWGDGRYEIIENTTGSEMALASIPHKYPAPPTGSVNIYVRKGTLDFGELHTEYFNLFNVYKDTEVLIEEYMGDDLCTSGTANCYIVSAEGKYKFKTVKGNSTISVGNPDAVEVLWESFGNATTISKGNLIETGSLKLKKGYVGFKATNKKGNAVIAVKNGSIILWSWHIWLTDEPKDQTYNNSAGIMMDRNLGATSTTMGAVEALGLLYQWGRKDPFLGANGKSSSTQAASTLSWPLAATGPITPEDAVKIPTKFITTDSSPYDWTDDAHKDNLWDSGTPDSRKTMYDPCPPGYRVPDGGSSGVFSNAFGMSSEWTKESNWDNTNKGMNFGKTDHKLGSDDTIWYPASGFRIYSNGEIVSVGSNGGIWSCSPNGIKVYSLTFDYYGEVKPAGSSLRVNALPVRCLRE